jgi:hypothetical protein
MIGQDIDDWTGLGYRIDRRRIRQVGSEVGRYVGR